MRASSFFANIRRSCFILFFPSTVFAQAPASPAGKWISNLKFFQENNYQRLELNISGTSLTGKLGNNDFQGTYENGRIEGTLAKVSKSVLAGLRRTN